MSGPVLVIPYRQTTTETSIDGGHRGHAAPSEVVRELTLEPEAVELATQYRPRTAQALDLRSGGL